MKKLPDTVGYRVEGIEILHGLMVTALPQVATCILWGREAADDRAGDLWAAGWVRVNVVYVCGGANADD